MGRALLLTSLALTAGCHVVSGLSDFRLQDAGGGADAQGGAATGGSGGTPGSGGTGSGAGGTGGAAAGYPGVVLADQPLVYWRLGDAPGKLPHDEVSNGPLGAYENDAVLGEPGVIPGDRSVFFEGTARLALDDGVIPIDFDGMAPFSIEAWVKLTAYPSNPDRGLLYKQSPEHGWRLSIRDDGRLRFVRRLDSVNDDCFSNAVPTDTWLYVVGTFDGTVQRLYVDGEQHDETNATKSIPDTDATFTLASVYGAQPAFAGWLDEVAIYDHALTPTIIAKHHDEGAP